MLPKEKRLKRRKDFGQVLKKGKGLKEDFLILKFIPNNLEESRFGIIVSQKVSKKATIRNKIRRQISELIRLKLPEIKKNIDAVLIALSGLETKNFWEIKEIITKLFKKAKMIDG